MAYLLFIVHLLLFLLLLRYLHVRRKLHIPLWVGVMGFLLKVLLGCLYGYIFLRVYGGDDTWMYHRQALEETAFLKNDPIHFLHSIIDPFSYTRYYMDTPLQEIEYASLIKLLAIMNLFSGGYYYVNVVIFCMISFWGAYFFTRFFCNLEPTASRAVIMIMFFFVPLVFWTSGIRKDGLIFLFTGMFFYAFQRFTTYPLWKSLAMALLSIILAFINRNFVALTILPAWLAWALARSTGWKTWKTFLLVYGTSTALFVLSSYLGPVNMLTAVVNRQRDFLALKGGSLIPLQPLTPDLLSFLKMLPQALQHVFLRPFPGEQPGLLMLFSGIETLFALAVMLLPLLFPSGHWAALRNPAMAAVLCFALLNYLFIGYTVPFLGAIVRYRAIYEALFMAAAVTGTRLFRSK